MADIEIPPGKLAEKCKEDGGKIGKALQELNRKVQAMNVPEASNAMLAKERLQKAMEVGSRTEVTRALQDMTHTEFAGLKNEIEDMRATIGDVTDWSMVQGEKLA